jgi:hypothetical protein
VALEEESKVACPKVVFQEAKESVKKVVEAY